MLERNGQVTFPRLIAAGVKKFAVVESKELVAQMSIEQTMEEEKSGTMQSHYFISMVKALEGGIK